MYAIASASNWLMLRHAMGRMILWTFRGQREANWGLSTSLERAARSSVLTTLAPGSGRPGVLRNRENWILQEFRRRAHHYIDAPPPLEDKVEWLALLQHHGGVTRLLDFTHSRYIACFFACLDGGRNEAAIWALNMVALGRGAEAFVGSPPEGDTVDKQRERHAWAANSILNEEAPNKGVLSVEPFRLNERMVAQQGAFMFPTSLDASFEANLTAALGLKHETLDEEFAVPLATDETGKFLIDDVTIVKIRLQPAMHWDAIRDLWDMNITQATLFPGLDGYARSLSYYVLPAQSPPRDLS